MRYMIFLLPLLLLSCGKTNHQDLRAYIKAVKNRPSGPIDPIPRFVHIPPHLYQPADRRSPFTPAVQKVDDTLRPDPTRPKEPLEHYTLDSLRLVGLFSHQNVQWALIRTPDNQVLPVRTGRYLGQNHGQVLTIGSDSIEIEEMVRTSKGWERRTTTLTLKQREA